MSSMSTTFKSTVKTKIKTILVNDHDKALQYIHKAIGQKSIPFCSNTLLHFDAHPDFVIANELTLENITNPKKKFKDTSFNENLTLYDKVSIESWIIPLILAGHVDHLIWVKNSYCDQFEVGEYTVDVGFLKDNHKKNDKTSQTTLKPNIGTTFYQNYFLADGKCCLNSDLDENAKTINFTVLDLNCRDLSNFPRLLQELLSKKPIILDVDLDIFSTFDPFRIILGKDNFNLLCEIYKIDVFDNKLDLENLKKQGCFSEIINRQEIFSREFSETTDLLEQIWKNGSEVDNKSNEKLSLLSTFIRNCKNLPNLHFETIISAAESLILPHHQSSMLEIEKYIENFSQLLIRFFQADNNYSQSSTVDSPPVLITVARSSEDEYCPRDQVLAIEKLVFERFYKIFGENNLQVYRDQDL